MWMYKILLNNPGCLPFQAWRTNRFQTRSRPKLTGRVLWSVVSPAVLENWIESFVLLRTQTVWLEFI